MHREHDDGGSELPPRARRILDFVHHTISDTGTTSACAENTFVTVWIVLCYRNYLRVRGEYYRGFAAFAKPRELPPRARRILSIARMWDNPDGTTSACAENT